MEQEVSSNQGLTSEKREKFLETTEKIKDRDQLIYSRMEDFKEKGQDVLLKDEDFQRIFEGYKIEELRKVKI